jgi:hypothetical protein
MPEFSSSPRTVEEWALGLETRTEREHENVGTFGKACADTQYTMLGNDSNDDETGGRSLPVRWPIFRFAVETRA